MGLLVILLFPARLVPLELERRQCQMATEIAETSVERKRNIVNRELENPIPPEDWTYKDR